MDKYIKYSDIPFCKIELEERCHNDRWTEIHEVAYKNEIDRIPAANVAPVRHGRWIELENGDCKCSLCGCYHHVWEAYGYYCQHCGARMDGDRE